MMYALGVVILIWILLFFYKKKQKQNMLSQLDTQLTRGEISQEEYENQKKHINCSGG